MDTRDNSLTALQSVRSPTCVVVLEIKAAHIIIALKTEHNIFGRIKIQRKERQIDIVLRHILLNIVQ